MCIRDRRSSFGQPAREVAAQDPGRPRELLEQGGVHAFAGLRAQTAQGLRDLLPRLAEGARVEPRRRTL
eukprot:8028892-Alexandrium_andersonii.AAC.1